MTETYRTPIDDELSGQAKNRIAGKYRDNPAFQDMMMMLQQFNSSIIDEKVLTQARDNSARQSINLSLYGMCC